MTRTCRVCGRNFDAESAVTLCGRCEFEGDCKPKPHECNFDLGDGQKALMLTCPVCFTRLSVQGKPGRAAR